MTKIPANLISRDEAIRRCALVTKHNGNTSKAAAEVGIDPAALRRSLESARKHYGVQPRAKTKSPVPMSEDQRKFHEEWTAQDCINELTRVCSIDTTKVITRNYFRVHSDISESTWNRFYGTFTEFKRQAEIILSRHAHGMERHIAKHASVDKMRVLNGEKREWEGKYLRPANGRWQSVLVGSDQHDKMCDPFYRRLFIDTALRAQPEKIILNGDLFDLPEFSKHTQDPREFDLLGRIRWVHEFLRDLRAAAPNAELTLIEGNHEYRLLRHMGEETPALKVVLADLHEFTIPKLLKLDQFEINYVAQADMTAFTQRDITTELGKNYKTFYDNALLFGHYPAMRNMGIPGANGHHHRWFSWQWYSPVTGPSTWMQIGAGHKREASYTPGEKWSNGFLLTHVDTQTKRSQFEYSDCSHDACMIGGKMYFRDGTEPVTDIRRAS